jgi:hypothetical protein
VEVEMGDVHSAINGKPAALRAVVLFDLCHHFGGGGA